MYTKEDLRRAIDSYKQLKGAKKNYSYAAKRLIKLQATLVSIPVNEDITGRVLAAIDVSTLSRTNN
jgi:hypothetical protein